MEGSVAIVLTFLLTTIGGGWWASKLQERSWVRQNDTRLREDESARANQTCTTLMSLLDRRLYRMQRLLWAATSDLDGTIDHDVLEERLAAYVEVLFAWNDSLNTNLSLTGSYFGDDARAYLDHLYEDYKRVGRQIEAVVRAARAGTDTSGMAATVSGEFEGRDVGSLNFRVYEFGLMLMGQLRDGRVGRAAPNLSVPLDSSATPAQSR